MLIAYACVENKLYSWDQLHVTCKIIAVHVWCISKLESTGYVETLGSSMSEHLSSIGFLPRTYDNYHPTG